MGLEKGETHHKNTSEWNTFVNDYSFCIYYFFIKEYLILLNGTKIFYSFNSDNTILFIIG